jgi:hypothetical protein
MNQAIITKYLPATNTKGSRIKARTHEGSVTIPYLHELSPFDVHRTAALLTAKKYKLIGRLVHAPMVGQPGYVFICVGDDE